MIQRFIDLNSILSCCLILHDNQPALESVLLSLREVAWDDQDELAGHVVEIAKLLIDLPIRIVSDGNVKLDELKRSYLDNYIEAADKASETSKEIRNMIDNYKEKTKKKILFIIDDLDRCRPSYAVELLESIKHCFNCDNAVFLICANNEQLQYTVKKYTAKALMDMLTLTGFMTRFSIYQSQI